jgi:hypothetical protein
MNLTNGKFNYFWLHTNEDTAGLLKKSHFQHACAPRLERSITSGHMEWSCSSLSEL